MRSAHGPRPRCRPASWPVRACPISVAGGDGGRGVALVVAGLVAGVASGFDAVCAWAETPLPPGELARAGVLEIGATLSTGGGSRDGGATDGLAALSITTRGAPYERRGRRDRAR